MGLPPTVPLLTPETPVPRTRCGYKPAEVTAAFIKALSEAGAHGTGKTLHYAADIVCSGGVQTVFRALWDYALVHVGIASPRIFVYLRQRITELEGMMKRLPDDVCYGTEEFQIRMGELILVTRDAPRRSLVPWPKVGQETHEQGWMRAAVDGATETAALRRVWRPEGDLSILRTAGSQLCKAIGEGSTDRALFWVKWLLEEEVLTRKAQKGASLSTIERGPAGQSKAARTDVSFFILDLYIEIYKEFAEKQAVRMHEEFKALVELWRSPPKGLGGGAKRQILALLTQILAEVPRWKVPAAPALIADPVFLSRAVTQTPKFYKEVLAYEAPKQPHLLAKLFKTRGGLAEKPKKAVAVIEDKTAALDKALAEYFGGAL